MQIKGQNQGVSPLLISTGIVATGLMIGISTWVSGLGQWAIATAPNIPPSLTLDESGSYLLSWTSDDDVYVSCYPGVTPTLVPAPVEWNPSRHVLRCGE